MVFDTAQTVEPTNDMAPLSPSTPPGVPPHPPLSPRSGESSPIMYGGVAMSKVETILLSSTGDLLVSRCRESSQAYTVPPETNTETSDRKQGDQGALELSWCGIDSLGQDEPLCPCTVDSADVVNSDTGGGLLGGNPPKGGKSDLPDSEMTRKQNGVTQASTSDALSSTIPVSPNASKGTEGNLSEMEASPEKESSNLFTLPSFDYSHFAEDGNDMIPGAVEPAQAPPKEPPARETSSFLSSVLEVGEKDEPEKTGTDLTHENESKPLTRPPVQPVLTGTPDDFMDVGGDHEPRPVTNAVLFPTRNVPPPPRVMHGIPTFLSSLPQISIRQVSAHPLGSHVLLISREALLFSFGLNDHGQLGNGRTCSTDDRDLGFVTTPTIITPLLENGGKAIACAAGVDHSLVVVRTDGRRLSRLRDNHQAARRHHSGEKCDSLVEMTRVTSSPPRIIGTDDESQEQSTTSSSTPDPSELIYHHQVYGFGRNDCMKLGLVNPVVKEQHEETEDVEEDVLLPRRVALHCSVWPGTTGRPSPGIFAIAASTQHSAALVRRATGAVELYTWGNAEHGALGPHNLVDEMSLTDGSTSKKALSKEEGSTPRRQEVATPSIVRKLSYIPSYEDSAQSQLLEGADEAISTKASIAHLSDEHPSGEHPIHLALGPKCTFVVTSTGRCISFGTSEDGLLGRGDGVTISTEPTSLVFPDSTKGQGTRIASVSVGARHAVALDRDGRAYTWGVNAGGRLGFGSHSNVPVIASHSKSRTDSDGINRGSRSPPSVVQWSPQTVDIRCPTSKDSDRRNHRSFSDGDLLNSIEACRLDGNAATREAQATRQEAASVRVLHACAGYDSTAFVTNSGRVLSCGAKSGRLGLGEVVSSVWSPEPMFGGLQLWRETKNVAP